MTANLIAWANANQGKGTVPFHHAHLVDNTRIFEAIVQSAAKGGAVISL